MASSTAESALALLTEEDDALKVYALQRINATVHENWHQASGAVATVEALFEDEDFSHRELAALVASKIFYYLGVLKEAQAYALGAGKLFEAEPFGDYVRAMLDSCLDSYIAARAGSGEDGEGGEAGDATGLGFAGATDSEDVDPRLVAVVQRQIDGCLASGRLEHVVGAALEARRADWLEAALAAAPAPATLLAHASDVLSRSGGGRDARRGALRALAGLYKQHAPGDAVARARVLTSLSDSAGLATLVRGLLRSGDRQQELLALRVAFDLVDAQTVGLARDLAAELAGDAASEAAAATAAAVEPEAEPAADAEDVSAPLLSRSEAAPAAASGADGDAAPTDTPLGRFLAALSGLPSIELERRFLAGAVASDGQLLRNLKSGVEPRNSVCHSAVVWANAVMHAGTGVDGFLRANLDWLAKATNWAKFGATAGLGVIQRGAVAPGRARALMGPYLPSSPGGATGSPYSEGGALYAVGLIHAGAGAGVRGFLLDSLKATQNEAIQHGACLGLGIACLGSADAECCEEVRNVLYTDGAVAGEAAGYALGLLCAGTGDAVRVDEMLAYARETAHEKIVRALGVGVALTQLSRESAAEGVVEALAAEQDSALRYGGALALGLAYAGTRSNSALARLLRRAVSDVSHDVRRGAASALGLVLLGAGDACPRLVSGLATSYDPHVRYGAAVAVGVACAGTGSREATTLLESMLTDAVDFVQQGVLIAAALVLAGQPAARADALRARIDKIHGNKGVEVMARMGAIMSAGILDAGGRNAVPGLVSRSGSPRPGALAGLALFLQYWYWHPLAYMLSLALQPAALIGVDATLRAPADFEVLTRAKPGAFAYPAPVAAEDKRARDKVVTAVLSTMQRSKARAAAKKQAAGGAGADVDASVAGVDATVAGVDAKQGATDVKPAADAPKDAAQDAAMDVDGEQGEEEPTSFTSANPARVTPAQRRLIQFPRQGRWQPVKPVTWGIVVLQDTAPPGTPVEYLYQEPKPEPEAPPAGGNTARPSPAVGAAPARSGDEPPPPAPFEYIPS